MFFKKMKKDIKDSAPSTFAFKTLDKKELFNVSGAGAPGCTSGTSSVCHIDGANEGDSGAP